MRAKCKATCICGYVGHSKQEMRAHVDNCKAWSSAPDDVKEQAIGVLP